MSRLHILMALAVAGTVAAACGSSPASPTTPSTPTPTGTVTAVSVASASPSGSSFQLTATAQLSDGTFRDVTTAAVWDTSNAAIAVVSSTGMVSVKSTGEIDVRATYVNVSGSLHLLVSPSPAATVSLTGVVRDVPPGSQPIPGARVDIIAGADAGKFAVADSAGAYRFDGLSNGRVSLKVTADGYQDWAVGNLPVTNATQAQDAWLYPVPPRDGTGAPPTARCNDSTWTWMSDTAAGCSAHNGVAYTLAPGTDRPSIRR